MGVATYMHAACKSNHYCPRGGGTVVVPFYHLRCHLLCSASGRPLLHACMCMCTQCAPEGGATLLRHAACASSVLQRALLHYCDTLALSHPLLPPAPTQGAITTYYVV